MLFKIIKYAVIFGLPFLLFFLWAWIARRRAAAGQVPLQQTPWITLTIVGLVLSIAALFVTGLDQGITKDGVYVAPTVVNGVIVPGHVE
jgi:hypothetical protein